MSNFQRTRSKVWWDSEDDYPTTYQAPKTPQNAQNVSKSSQNTANNLNKDEHTPIDNQILQKYLAENQNVRDVPTYYEEQQSASPNHQLSGDKNVVGNLDSSKNNLEGFQNLSSGSPRPYPRMLRAASPASHRSQDSGFSDSDCSPAQTAPKPIKREENWQRVIESLRISKSSDAICSRNDQAVVNDVKVSTSNGIDFESQLDENFWKNLKAPKKSNTSTPNTIAQFNSIQTGFTPDLQKIQLTPLKNFMQTHQDDKKVEPKNNIVEKSKSVDVDISNVQRRPKLLSVRSCPDGRTNSVHRLIYKFDHGESPLPGFKPSVTKNQTDEDNSKNISHVEVLSNTKTKDDTLDKNNLIADTLTKSNMSSFEVYRHVPKNVSRKIEYIDYSQMCCGPINEEGYTADQSTVSLSPEMFHEKLDELNFSNVSTLSEDLPDGHKTSLNLTGSPLYQSRLFEETDRNSMIHDNELNMAKIVSPKKRTDTFSQGAMDDSYFYKKRQGLANKSLPNPRSDKNGARYKLNLTLSPEKLGNPQIIAESDANNVTTVSVNSYNSIDDYDILYSKKPEPNNNTVEITTTPENMCHVTCANKKSQETEIADTAFSTPSNAQKCYNNETYELQLPSSSKPYAGTYDQNLGGKLSDEITLPSSDSDLAPSCTSTPKWYKPSEVKQLTPVSHRKIAVHRRVNLLAGFNAAPEDSDKENSPRNEDENKVGIKIVDGKVWVKSKSTNCEKDMVPSSTGSRSNTPDRSGPKDIFEEERPGDVTPKFNKEADKNIFEETRTPKIKKDKNLLTKIFGKKTTPANAIQNNTNALKVCEDLNLPKSNNSKIQQEVIPQPRKSLQRPESVKSWLRELADTCEPEAMTALQNKAIRGSANFKSNLKAESVNKDVESVLSNVNAVRRIAEHAAGVLEELENVQRCIIGNKPELSGPLLQSALGGVTSFVKSNVATPSSNALLKQCDAVKVSGKPTDLEDLARIATGVRAHVEEQCLKYLEILSDTLEEPPSSQCLSAALSGLGALCSAYGGAIGYSAVKAGLIRALLIVCVNSHTYTLRQNTNGEENQLTAPSSSLGKALRVLATLCQTEQSIRQFCQAGGVSVLQDILEDKRCAEPERREACAVLTQITGPWVTNETEINKDKNNKHQNWDWRQELNKHKTQLVRALTDLLSETKCCQTLLLCAAALANASLPRMSTFNDNTQVMSPNSVAVTESLAWCEAATELLKAVKRRGPGCSVFLQEQTSSLLCNLSAVQECRRRLCPSSKNPANSSEPIMAIFSFLNTCRRFIAPEESASFRRGVMRASERMDYSSSLLQNSVRAKSDQSRSSTKSERLPRTPDNFFTNSSSKTNLELSSFKSPESPKFTPAEKASAERMLISTTLCLTRFCRDREVARFCFKLGSQRYLLLAADLLKMQQQKNVKEVLAVCEETARIISAYGNNDTSLVTVNESYV